MPVRRVPLGRRSLTGRVPAAKAGGSVEFESSLERDYVTLLVFDQTVVGFETQPCRISWLSPNGRLRHYVPDFYVQYRPDQETGQPRCDLLCEIKYRSDLAANWKYYKTKFKAARRYARERGWCFRIFTDCEIRTPYLDNARFLLQYRDLPAYLSSEDLIRKALFDLRQTDTGGVSRNPRFFRHSKLSRLRCLG